MKKTKTIYLSEYNGDITEQLKTLAKQILADRITVEFNVSYEGCYYEGDSPAYELLIKDKNE